MKHVFCNENAENSDVVIFKLQEGKENLCLDRRRPGLDAENAVRACRCHRHEQPFYAARAYGGLENAVPRRRFYLAVSET